MRILKCNLEVAGRDMNYQSAYPISHEIYKLDDPTDALPCSQVYAAFPSIDSSLITPCVSPMRLPRCTTQLSTNTLVPSWAGRRYVQLTVQIYNVSIIPRRASL